MTSPTQRTKAELVKQGYTVAIVERWNPFARVRQDLYGCIDILAMKANMPLLAIQCTTTANLVARIVKANETAATWRSTGNRFEFWGWSKKGKRGERKLWTLTIRER